MKTFFILTVVIGIVFASCQQEDEMVYSCNEKVNSWVKDNLSNIQKMKGNEFLALDLNYQRAIYNAYLPEQRQEQWVLKIKETLKMEWSNIEKEHLNVLLSKIMTTSELFNSQILENEKDEFKIWTYKWVTYAEDNLGWEPQLIKSIIGMPHRLLNKKGEFAITRVSLSKKNREL